MSVSLLTPAPSTNKNGSSVPEDGHMSCLSHSPPRSARVNVHFSMARHEDLEASSGVGPYSGGRSIDSVASRDSGNPRDLDSTGVVREVIE